MIERVYLDTSALVKLLITEDESEALRTYLRSAPPGATSALATVELRRAVAWRAPSAGPAAEDLLARFELLELDSDLLESAATIAPDDLRTLHAIHLASAVRLGESLSSLVTYDVHLESAGRATGVPTCSPR